MVEKAMSPHEGERRYKNRPRFKKVGAAKKSKKEDEMKEMESIISRCGELSKANTTSFKRFSDLPLSSKTLRGLKECDYEEPTDIQRESLPFSLSGLDVVGAAKTGSGKTLALIIPVLESLWRSGWSNYCGLGALIISPTRELALQTFTVINHVGKYHDFSCALLIGGTDVEYEKSRLGRVNIIICTPGRLLQHMDENEQLLCDELQILVLDEADRILDMGFSQQVNAIVANLPKERQTLLFSATQTRNIKDLTRVCTKDPVFVSAHERCAHVTPDCLVQSYMVCEDQDKVNTMWSFIINNKKSKTIIFVSSCKQARFLTGAFCHLRPGLPVMGLWGTMNQKKRVDVFQKFENKEAAVMIATDVASRGLDFSDVDWVVQVDCPASVEDYIHRVGRTARMNQSGHAVLFLTSSQEEPMVAALRRAYIPLTKQIADPRALVDIRTKMQATLSQFPELNQFAQKSLVAYLRSIYMMRNKKVFDVTTIDAAALAASYGLVTVPRVRFLSKKGITTKVLKIESCLFVYECG
ncbi:DEAD/DEAH box helicase [Ostertagia ostertagi]